MLPRAYKLPENHVAAHEEPIARCEVPVHDLTRLRRCRIDPEHTPPREALQERVWRGPGLRAKLVGIDPDVAVDVCHDACGVHVDAGRRVLIPGA